MAVANLEILDLDVPLGWFHVYHDDGFIDSIVDHVYNGLMMEYGGIIVPFPSPLQLGGYVCLSKRFKRHHHIFYIDSQDETVNIGVRAHEEMEFVIERRKEHLLADKILKEQGITIDFEDIYDRQVKAFIGTMYALTSRRISLDDYINGQSHKGDVSDISLETLTDCKKHRMCFDRARKIYESAQSKR